MKKIVLNKVKVSGKLAWFKRLGRMQQRSLVVLLVALVSVGGFLTYRSFAGSNNIAYFYTNNDLTTNGRGVKEFTGNKRNMKVAELTAGKYAEPRYRSSGTRKVLRICYSFRVTSGSSKIQYVTADGVTKETSYNVSSDYRSVCTNRNNGGTTSYPNPRIKSVSGNINLSYIQIYFE